MSASVVGATPAVMLRDAGLRFGARVLWDHLSIDVAPGEFVAVLGPNGAGKTTLIQILLGLQSLTSGSVEVNGRTPRRGSRDVGYIPQQKAFDPDLPIRGRDLVQFAVDGHRIGLPFARRATRRRVDDVIESVGATHYANAPVGLLSGGEQQRLRVAQALLGGPKVLLCDEPLLSLDLAHQRAVSELIHGQRKRLGTAVVFVTHDINPVLGYVDRVLYLVEGRSAVGSPAEVLTSERLSDLYATQVDVINVRGRIIVLGADDEVAGGGHHHHPEPPVARRRSGA